LRASKGEKTVNEFAAFVLMRDWPCAAPRLLASHGKISASHGKVKRNPSFEEFKRQQAHYNEHAEAISQAMLCGKHWQFPEKHRVLVVGGVVLGWV
jgi:hypothetical protein